MPMIAITTSSSTNVNPRRGFNSLFRVHEFIAATSEEMADRRDRRLDLLPESAIDNS
jgi:hypothetical protein